MNKIENKIVYLCFMASLTRMVYDVLSANKSALKYFMILNIWGPRGRGIGGSKNNQE